MRNIPQQLLFRESWLCDCQSRGKLQDELLSIWEKQRTAVLFVTHSIDETLRSRMRKGAYPSSKPRRWSHRYVVVLIAAERTARLRQQWP